jgi:hypothetical protein
MANTKRTQQPPAVGSRPSVRVTDDFADDLAVLMGTGADFSTAVRDAVRIVADIYRTAHNAGITPPDTAPRLLAYQLAPRTTAPVDSVPFAQRAQPIPALPVHPRTAGRDRSRAQVAP